MSFLETVIVGLAVLGTRPAVSRSMSKPQNSRLKNWKQVDTSTVALVALTTNYK